MAAAATMNGVTAWQMVHEVARVRPGQTVLVHGASGGVGTLLVQLAVAAGARVLGTASAAKHAASGSWAPSRSTTGRRTCRHGCARWPRTVWTRCSTTSAGRACRSRTRLLADGGILINYGSATTLREPDTGWCRTCGTMRRFAGWWLGRLVGRGPGRRASFYYVKPGPRFNRGLSEVYRWWRGVR